MQDKYTNDDHSTSTSDDIKKKRTSTNNRIDNNLRIDEDNTNEVEHPVEKTCAAEKQTIDVPLTEIVISDDDD